MALLIRDHGVVREFPWLQLTVLGENYTDQHFLYHVLLIPFVTWFPPLVGLKLATVFFAASLVTVLYWMMKQFHVRWPLLFIAILLLSRPWTFRLSLAKAPSTSLIFLFVGLTWMFQYHIRRLAVLAFTYVWYYGGFPLLTVAAVTSTTVSYLHNRLITKLDAHRWLQKIFSVLGRHARREKIRRHDRAALLAVVGGTIAGVIVNPYFPGNLQFYLHQLINIGIINFRNVIGVGSEWYAYNFGDLIANGALASLLILLAFVGMIFRFKAQSKQTWTLAILTAFFFVLTLKSRRYVEYYIPFAVIFSAFSISDSLRGSGGQAIFKELRSMFGRSQGGRLFGASLVVLIVFGVAFIGGRDWRNNLQDLRGGFSATLYQGASTWLATNTPPGSRVVHSDWDEFPVLFYHNSHNYYIVGLDPTFLYKASTETYWTWANLTLGKYNGDAYQAVTKTLQSGYVFITTDHTGMRNIIEADGHFRLRYRDNEAAVYEAVDSKL